MPKLVGSFELLVSRKFKRTHSFGFTMVELLVVISIIGILSTIGISTYSSAQANGRDTRRRGEIDAINQALELNKQDVGYQALTNAQFGSGSIPTNGPTGDPYCINTSGASAPSSTWTSCNTIGAGWVQVSSGAPSGNPTQYIVCASLERSPVFCRSNSQ